MTVRLQWTSKKYTFGRQLGFLTIFSVVGPSTRHQVLPKRDSLNFLVLQVNSSVFFFHFLTSIFLTKNPQTKKTEEISGPVNGVLLKSDGVYAIFNGARLFVWIGSKVEQKEKEKVFQQAHEFLIKENKSALLPTSFIFEGYTTPLFENFLK